jgi:hypothetical protein
MHIHQLRVAYSPMTVTARSFPLLVVMLVGPGFLTTAG